MDARFAGLIAQGLSDLLSPSQLHLPHNLLR